MAAEQYFVIKKGRMWVSGSATESSEIVHAKVFAEGQTLPVNEKLDRFEKVSLTDWIAAVERDAEKAEAEARAMRRRLESVRREFR